MERARVFCVGAGCFSAFYLAWAGLEVVVVPHRHWQVPTAATPSRPLPARSIR